MTSASNKAAADHSRIDCQSALTAEEILMVFVFTYLHYANTNKATKLSLKSSSVFLLKPI